MLRLRLAASAILVLATWALLLHAAASALRSVAPGIELFLLLSFAFVVAGCAMLVVASVKASLPPLIIGIISFTLYLAMFAFVVYSSFAAVRALI